MVIDCSCFWTICTNLYLFILCTVPCVLLYKKQVQVCQSLHNYCIHKIEPDQGLPTAITHMPCETPLLQYSNHMIECSVQCAIETRNPERTV